MSRLLPIGARRRPWFRRPRGGASLGLAMVLIACVPRSPSPAPAPAGVGAGATPAGAGGVAPGDAATRRREAPALPAPVWPAPAPTTGPLAIRVVYPKPNDVISARDSNFMFGSVGSGDATLSINGTAVPVQPNGAFLAWLPVPAGVPARYDLVATRGADTARAVHLVRPPAPVTPWADTGRLAVQPGSVVPAPGNTGVYRGDEPIRVGVRTSATAEVTLVLADSSRLPLISGMQRMAMLGANGRGDATLWQAEVAAARLGRPTQLLVT
ncbi:MAG: hypothetical protein MUF53_12870, partial [Gemmatimonadaceae bacterium]|nr:hypothetical protein [Gemmatimonadaceae bacterium]